MTQEGSKAKLWFIRIDKQKGQAREYLAIDCAYRGEVNSINGDVRGAPCSAHALDNTHLHNHFDGNSFCAVKDLSCDRKVFNVLVIGAICFIFFIIIMFSKPHTMKT